ncbi:MAG TPA: efflux RND transporter periplasmic adaptor subunit [Gemmatimonadales bacterium]|nr:efflux RND transporter periplasmic adaptor subunit [Gemmatimonadales bacterium]
MLLFAAVLLAAGAGSWALTRHAAAPTAAAGHVHGAGPAGDAMPVALGSRDQQRIGVTFAPVERGPLRRDVRTVAQVTYDETRVKTVAPLIEGWVDRLYVNYTGQAVRPGDALFTIYSPMVVAAQQELLLARRLASDVAGGTPDAARGTRDLVEAARRRLRYWGVADAEIRAIEASGEVRRTVTLRSPYTGVVVAKPVLAGQRLMPGDVAYTIADLSRIWLEGEVFERDLPAVRLGLSVRAEFTALPGTVRTGRVTYIYPTVNPETRTARIRVELANPDLALKPGMYATIRFAAPSEPTLSVPRSAVLSTGERHLLFLRDSTGRFVPRLVVLGSATDDRVEILSGVALGDTVVASGTFLVDAESNLGTLMGGMGNMPGMDMTAPTTPGESGTPSTTNPHAGHSVAPADPHAGHGGGQ